LTQVAGVQYEILELNERLSKLQGLSSETDPAMLAIVRGLACACNRMGNWKLAEYWWRRVVTTSQMTREGHSPQSLLDHQELIRAIVLQGRPKEAKELYKHRGIKSCDFSVCAL